jgi:cysteine-rich repeat protein
MRGAAFLVCLGIAACIHDPSIRCGELACPAGLVCTAIGCASEDQLAACAGLDDGAVCMTPSFPVGSCTSGVCEEVACGDGKLVGPEVCDDGNQRSNDGCSADCVSLEVCGNDYIDAVIGEQCDTGLAGLSRDGCTSVCTLEFDSWFDVSPVTAADRIDAVMAADRRGRIVMFGGTGVGVSDHETWEWDGSVWRHLEPARFPTVTGPMAYDAHRGVTVLYDGDTWEWDGTIWTRSMAPQPPARTNAVLAYDPIHRETLLFGGQGKRDTWGWDGTAWIEHVVATPPPAGISAVMAFDTSANQMILYFTYVPQTWAWDGSTWTQLATGQSPSVRVQSAAASRPGGGIVIYGGVDPIGLTTLADTWVFSAGAWTPSAASGPADRAQHAMAYDVARDCVVLFGGEQFGDTRTTWEFTGGWQPVTPQLDPGAGDMSAAYDPSRGRTVVFDQLGNTWEWDGLAWQLVSTTGPPGRYSSRMVGTRDRVVMFGGNTLTGSQKKDLWDWNGVVWAQHPAQLPARFVMAAYDTRRDRIVACTGSGGPSTAQTWEYDGTTWLLRTPAHSPPDNLDSLMAYDAVRGQIVVWSRDGTWEWDGNDWTKPVSATSPPIDYSARMAFDATRGRVTWVGGATSTYVATWEWDGTAWSVVAPVVSPRGRSGHLLVYDAARAELVLFGGGGLVPGTTDETWRHHYFSQVAPRDACIDVDTDGDHLAGCADPDCWGRCTPLCPPGAPCDPALPHCGDGTCSPIEDDRLCPADCPPFVGP